MTKEIHLEVLKRAEADLTAVPVQERYKQVMSRFVRDPKIFADVMDAIKLKDPALHARYVELIKSGKMKFDIHITDLTADEQAMSHEKMHEKIINSEHVTLVKDNIRAQLDYLIPGITQEQIDNIVRLRLPLKFGFKTFLSLFVKKAKP